MHVTCTPRNPEKHAHDVRRAVDRCPIVGVSQIQFHRESDSLEAAIRSAIGDVRSAGFNIERVEMEPDTLLQPI